MPKPKIAIIISHPIQHFCPQYISYTKAQDWEIKVFFASSLGLNSYIDKNFNEKITWNNLRLEEFPHIFLNEGRLLPINSKLDAPGLEITLKEYNPDIVIVNGYYQKFQRRARKWALQNKKKVCYISDSENRQYRNIVKEFLKQFYLRLYFKSIHQFLSVGDANEALYLQYGVSRNKITRVPFPIDLSLYNNSFINRDVHRSEVRTKYGIKENDIVCSVVGKLIPIKSQLHLIQTLPKLKSSITLLIVGSGPDSDFLHSLSHKIKNHKIIFTGFVNPGDLPMYYAASDIYVHPARSEPHSLAISEAIFMGCPVILSDRCGSWGSNDDVQPEKNGFVFPWGDLNKLAEYLEFLILNDNVRKQFSDHSITISHHYQNLAHGEGLKRALSQIHVK